MKALGWSTLLVALMCAASPAVAQRRTGSLQLTSFPPGATVAIDGDELRRDTPLRINLPLGEHTVTVSIPGSRWLPETRTVTITRDDNELNIYLVPEVPPGPPGPTGPPGPLGPPGP